MHQIDTEAVEKSKFFCCFRCTFGKVSEGFNVLEINKTGTSQVGAISKAQKAQNIFLEKNLKFSRKKFLSENVAQCQKM